jgi:8-oxo-dGTP diphosphatase
MLDVTCAIIRNEEDEVLIVQRGETSEHPFKWEFPGGKILPEETEEECILREIQEELSMEIVIFDRLPEVVHDYGFKIIRLIPFICDTLDEFPFLSEHMAFKWISAEELKDIDFSEADIPVAVSYLGKVNHKTQTPGESIPDQENEIPDDDELQSMIDRMISMKQVEWIAASAIQTPAIFNKLLEYSFSDDSRLAFHASWTLTKVCDKYPEIIYPHFHSLIGKLMKLENESVQRSFLRILSLSDVGRVSGKDHGILADHCFSLLRSGFSAVAIKAYSMEILYKLVLIYPELRNELSASIGMLLTEASGGILARGRQILKKLAETS